MNTITYQNIFPDDVSLMLGDMIPSWCQYKNLLSHYNKIGVKYLSIRPKCLTNMYIDIH